MVRTGRTVGPVSEYDGYQSESEDCDAAMASTSSDRSPLLGTMASKEGQKTFQYIGAIVACISAMSGGTTMGWTSPGLALSQKGGGWVSDEDFSWTGAFLGIGACIGVLPLGSLANVLGRKKLLMFLAPPMVAGWALIAWANSVWMLFVGRMICGAVTGTFCVVAPMYTGEIAEDSIRGVLGSFFQLLLTAGILFVYALDALSVSVFAISVACGIIPIVMVPLISLFPDTPRWYLLKGRDQEARDALVRFRGPNYDVDEEIRAIKESIENEKKKKLPLTQAFTSKAAKKGLFLALSVMFFQQFSGINAVIFYASDIFNDAGVSLKASISTVIVGCAQILATYVSTLLIDRLGRRILLIVSGAFMALSGSALGVFFYLKTNTQVDVASISMLPIVCMVVFIVMFSVGFGPIPWLYMSEVFSDQIKGPAMSIATVANWFCVFIVTKFYKNMADGIGTHSTFWIFAAISVGSCFFSRILLIETKGKSFEQIQAELEGVEYVPSSVNQTSKEIESVRY